MSCVYLIHIHPPLAHARHYIGYTKEDHPDKRIAVHQRGQGSRLLAAAVSSGRTLELVHHWPGADQKFERWLKCRRDVGKWCPVCGSGERSMPSEDMMSEKFLNRRSWK